MKKAVLLLTFNRPKETQAVIQAIKQYQPQKLYVASDGPRNDKEAVIVNTVRDLFQPNAWPCTLYKQWNTQNKGCRQGISEAISWFFANETDGIILEDDCVPDPTFFPYCEELLEKYADEQSVFCLAGSNYLNSSLPINDSYWFSQMNYSWGWATWARAWKYFKQTEDQLTQLITDNKHLHLTHNKIANQYLVKIIENTYSKKVDSWANLWAFTQLLHKGVCAVPSTNLIKNIGFDENATHTKTAFKGYINPVIPLPLPISHPLQITPNYKADDITFNRFYRFYSPLRRLMEKLKRAPSYPYRKLKRMLHHD